MPVPLKYFDVIRINTYRGIVTIDSREALRRIKRHKLTPLEEYPGAQSKPWKFRCELCGDSVEESVHSLAKRSRPGCRVCCSASPHRITPLEAVRRLGEFKLAPLEPYPGKISDAWRVSCDSCGGETTTRVSTLKKGRGLGCTQCALDTSHEGKAVTAEQAVERLLALDLEPLEPYPGRTHAQWKHLCRVCGLEDDWSLNYVESNYPCRNCRKLSNDAVREQSAIARMRATGVEPLVPYPGASEPWKSKCLECDKEVFPTLMAAERQSPCVYCARRRYADRRIAASKARAEEQLEKSGFEPLGVYRGFTRPWKAKCRSCGEISSPSAKDLAAGHGCKWCARNAPWSEQRFRKVLKLANRTSVEEFRGATTPILLQCNRCGAEGKVKPSMLKYSKGFCTRCKPNAEWTAEKATQLMKASGMEPLEPFVNMTTPWRSVCSVCGTEGSPQATNLASGQGGCKVCGNYGFDISKPTTLYVLRNRELGAVKVGITNTGSTRLRSLAGVGFVPGKLYEFDEGSEPLRIETLLLRHIKKDLRLKQALKQSQMRGVGGATETFWSDQLATKTIYARIRKLMSGLGGVSDVTVVEESNCH